MTYNLRAIDDIQRLALITYRARRGGHAIPEGLIGEEAGAALGTIPQSLRDSSLYTREPWAAGRMIMRVCKNGPSIR